jgi:hypothetical protein
MALISLNNLERFFNNLKTYISNALNSKANTSHTHTSSDITDLTVDSALSSSSENPVQNKVVKNALDGKLDVTDVFATWSYANGNLEIPNVFSNTVDSSLSNSSENPVQNKVINAALAGYIPRSGGAVMTGPNLGRTVNTGVLALCAGGDSNSGGNIILYANAYGDAGYQGAIALYALTSASSYKLMLMLANGTWTWDGTACQITSDQRYKQQINKIDTALLDAWEDVELSQFKYNDAVDQKGDNARLHTGYVVQQIDKACKSHNVDISEYGLYCHEEYPEETEEVEVEQKDGTKVKERKVIREASEHYSLRYTEALIVECAYLRKKNKELQEQLDNVIARLDKLEKGDNVK